VHNYFHPSWCWLQARMNNSHEISHPSPMMLPVRVNRTVWPAKQLRIIMIKERMANVIDDCLVSVRAYLIKQRLTGIR